MPNVAIRGVLARLCLGLTEVQPDAELLENYIATRDEAAFASLVERHGPKVFAVCRRLLGQHQLAEDAYQATFVVLAKKAHTIQPRSAVGGFLYGVARKAALEAYAVSRRRKETLVETVPDSPAAPLSTTDSDVLAMLDEEIANLSDTYRAAVVLCELDGVGRAEAARQLGIAEGTLSSRLAAARKQLATRLKARGVVFSAGLMSSLATSASAAIPPAIASATTAVSLIATGVLRTMLLAKFKLATTVCVLVTAIIGMSTFVPKSSMEAKAAPVPKVEKDEGLIWMYGKKTSTLTAYMPDGKVAKTIPLKDGKHFRGFTPDGSQLMFAGKNGKLVEQNVTDGLTLHLRDINDTVEGTDTGLGCQSAELIVFSPDMKKIVRSRTETMENIAGKDYPRYSHVLFDLATKIETPVDVPNDFMIRQWSADGKSWRAMQDNLGDPSLPRFRWHTVPVAGGKPTPINDKYTFYDLTPSPDGKTLLGTGFEHSINYVPGTIECFNVTGEKATVTPVVQFEKVAFVWLKWSPDGRQVAYLRLEYDPENGIKYDRTLCVCNSDGSDAKKLQQFKNDNHNTNLLGWFPTKIARPKQPIAADRLVPKLGSGVFAEREAAQKELRALGLAALPALKAGLQSSDPEVVSRCETLIDRIGKDDAEAFAKAFLADKDFRANFAHPIWTRWVKLIGDNRGSRELFAEMLSADGAAVALAYMADAKPKDAAERYRVELRKICSRVHPRTILSQSSTIAMSNRTLVGEASLAAYLGTYEGTADAVKLRDNGSYPEFEYEADLLHTLCEMPWVQQGSVWPAGILNSFQPKPLEGESLKRGYRMQKPGWKLYVASLAVRMNPRSVQSGLQGFNGYKSDLLDIAKAVIRNPKLPSTCRVMAIPILGECEAFDYLPDIVALQNDKTFVESGPQVNGREVSVEVRDVSIAVQLLMHKQSLADFEFFVAKAADEQTRRFPTWQFIPKYHAFPDDASRSAAHVKALAFLKTAKKPESVKRMLSKLKVTAAPEQAEMMLGEPIDVTFTIANPTDQNWRVLVGGNDRNRLGRPNSFQVDVVGPDGKAVPQPDSGMDMGGITSSKPLPAKGEYTFRLFLPHWATFAKTGDYTIVIRRKLQVVPDDNNHAFGPNANELDLSATTKIKVVAADAGQFGVLIAKLGKLSVDRESPERERATQMLRAIRDPRTVPYYITLSKQPHHEPRMTACQGLADYGTDEAFEALNALTKTPGADLRGSATTVKLEESSAAGVRQSAVYAIGKNPHKDALATLWTFAGDADYAIRITVLHKAAEIETAEATAIIETMTEDANATVRDEAKRYRSERAKRGK